MSARPHRFLHADGAGSLLSTRPMSFYALQERFWQLHDEATFSPAESHLYFYLLRLFNAARWPAKIYRKRNALAAEVNLDFKTLDKARARLESRGLLTYVAGNKVQSATWSLADCSQMAGNISLPAANSSQMQGNNSPAKGNNPPDCSQMEGKISPLYKEEEKTTTKEEEKTSPPQAAAAAGGGPEKKIGASSPAENPDASASHTRGGAARPKPAKLSEPPAAFTAFWAIWPRREAKADALRAFAKLEAPDQAAAASRAEAWLAARPDLLSPERQRYLPHPATWLNQHRWTDTNPQPATAPPYATANQSGYAARSSASAKPSAEVSGQLAVTLSDFLAE